LVVGSVVITRLGVISVGVVDVSGVVGVTGVVGVVVPDVPCVIMVDGIF
jgi:hypothetical protein